MTLRTISYGGGVQSNALMVLAALGKVDADTLLFANTGDDSEHPATLGYVRNVARPYAEAHGLTLYELRRTYRDGSPYPTLWEAMTRENSRRVPIPMRMRTGVPASRTCTADWKAGVLAKWRRQHGATAEDPAVSMIGFSTDEWHRANKRKAEPWEAIEYPLLDLRMSRADCLATIRRAGLPEPPKSACWFCPWTKPNRWAELRRDDPATFDKAADLEEFLSDRNRYYGNGPLWMTDRLTPLRLISEAQDALPFVGPEGCEEGACWT